MRKEDDVEVTADMFVSAVDALLDEDDGLRNILIRCFGEKED